MALLALADALEEQGDARAAGLRVPLKEDYCPARWGEAATGWQPFNEHRGGSHTIPRGAWDRLEGGTLVEYTGWKVYPTRSAALLALAAALVGGQR